MSATAESQVIAEINLDAIASNVKALKGVLPPNVKLMAVAKSNGYGHGGPAIAKTASKAGAHWIGVARFDEAMALRDDGVLTPVLIFGHTREERAGELAQYNLTQTICSEAYAQALSQNAQTAGKKVEAHIKLDTGMGRLGILHDSVAKESIEETQKSIERILALPGLSITGIYTHFTSAEEADNPDTQIQNERFSETLRALNRRDLLTHASNGASIFLFPETLHGMVRAGSLVYGLTPPELEGIAPPLTPAMTLKTRVAQIKTIPKGFALGYNGSWRAERDSIIATIPLGYGDGFSRRFSNNGAMLVKGRKAPIAGKVCMDMTMLDVTDIPGVQPGDEVVVFGFQGEAYLPALEAADRIDTIPEEILVGLTMRVPRVYIHNANGVEKALAG